MRRFLLIILLLLGACQPASAPDRAGFSVRQHPDGGLYVGDLVSFEVIPPAGFVQNSQTIKISIGEKTLGQTSFQPFGLGGKSQATFYWVWDTSELEAGSYQVDFSITPAKIRWTETYTLRPAAELPPPEPNARWESTESDCCIIHYMSNTAAERDLAALEKTTDAQAAAVEKVFGQEFDKKIAITFLPRVLGHGGFANNEVFVSYLDQNYAGGSFEQVLHHEFVHLLDSRTSDRYKPTILVEGLAVYLSGGHFKREPIIPRAAALLPLGRYIPLETLSNNFYPSQHEVGYIEAAALIGYLVQTYGWEPFLAFYRGVEPIPDSKPATELDFAFQKHFQRSFAEMESDLLAFLRGQTVTPAHLDDMRLTIDYYDTMRAYQQQYDPSAYYLTAWFLDINQMRERGIVADYLRHPTGWQNGLFETLLISANSGLLAGEYPQVEIKLKILGLLLGQ
jgi:hypothetical protein